MNNPPTSTHKRSQSNNNPAIQINIIKKSTLGSNLNTNLIKKKELTPNKNLNSSLNSSVNIQSQRVINSNLINKIKPNTATISSTLKPNTNIKTSNPLLEKHNLIKIILNENSNKFERVSDILNYGKSVTTRTKSQNGKNNNENSTKINLINNSNNNSGNNLNFLKKKSPVKNTNLNQFKINKPNTIIGNVSFDKSYGSNNSNMTNNKVINNSKSPKFKNNSLNSGSKSPVVNKNIIKPKSPSHINKLNSKDNNNVIKSSVNSNNKIDNYFVNKNSLLKQHEDNKNRSISPININLVSGSKMGSNLIKTEIINVKSNGTPSTLNNIRDNVNLNKNSARMTIQVSQPEYLIKMANLNNKKDFSDNNTSPMLLKRKPNEASKIEIKQTNSLLQAKLNQEIKIKENLNSSNSPYIKNKVNSMIKTELKTHLLAPSILEKNTITKKIKEIQEVTKIGFSGTGVKKINQDISFIHKNFNDNPDIIFMAVCDGHGMYGHEASQYLKDNLGNALNTELRNKKINLMSNNKNSHPNLQLNKIIESVFISTNSKLFNEAKIDTNFSGSTCVSLIYTTERLICANVGDSRCVIGRFVNGVWTSFNLSRDHKPDEKDEAARIKRRGGRIEPYRDENDEFIGPPRIWLKTEDIPGLAMTRAFGDQIAASVGILAEPEIMEWKFTNEDKFFILASDGVWEFIESQECVNIIKDFYLQDDIKGACDYLIEESQKRWLNEEEVIDDTTLILVFFE